MTLHDIAFPLGPVGAMFVWPLAVLALIVASRRSRWAVKTGTWLSAGVVVIWLTYMALQQLEFTYVAGQESAPLMLSVAVAATAGLCALGVLGLAATAGAAVVMSRRLAPVDAPRHS